jgi:hypothetical protein
MQAAKLREPGVILGLSWQSRATERQHEVDAQVITGRVGEELVVFAGIVPVPARLLAAPLAAGSPSKTSCFASMPSSGALTAT